MAHKRRIAWCSSVIIDAIQNDSDYWPQMVPMYDAALAGTVEVVVSEISVAEACRLNKLKDKGIPDADIIRMLKDFFDNNWILRRPVDRRESELGADLIRTQKLETCDAVIVATALVHQAEALFTRDGLKPSKLKYTKMLALDGKLSYPMMPSETLKICPPNAMEWQNMPLFKKPIDE